MQGCCCYGAHFTDDDDLAPVEADRRAPDRRAVAVQARSRTSAGGIAKANEHGETVTRLVDGACIFLNRPGFPPAPGCALHQAAVDAGERLIDWKPEVCWQLPLRRVDETDDYGHVTSTLREWKRRDWGDGGDEFHWWCTESPRRSSAPSRSTRSCATRSSRWSARSPTSCFVQHVQATRAGRRHARLPPPPRRRPSKSPPLGVVERYRRRRRRSCSFSMRLRMRMLAA